MATNLCSENHLPVCKYLQCSPEVWSHFLMATKLYCGRSSSCMTICYRSSVETALGVNFIHGIRTLIRCALNSQISG